MPKTKLGPPPMSPERILQFADWFEMRGRRLESQLGDKESLLGHQVTSDMRTMAE